MNRSTSELIRLFDEQAVCYRVLGSIKMEFFIPLPTSTNINGKMLIRVKRRFENSGTELRLMCPLSAEISKKKLVFSTGMIVLPLKASFYDVVL